MDRAKQLEREAEVYVKERCKRMGRALHLTPTLEEIRAGSFSDYVRSQIISRASADTSDDDDDDDSSKEEEEEEGMKPEQVTSSSQQHQQQHRQEEIEWNRGIAKVTLPNGFWDEAGIAHDRTGRGPQWQQGTTLGELSVKQPIQQVLDGIGGIYEYTLLEKSPMPLWKFRNEADAFCTKQLGRRAKIVVSAEDDDSDDYWDDLAKRFWKRLGPTMAHPLYGADMEGSLFGSEEEASGWSLEHLDNCLKLLDASDDTKMPGVTTPYLYVGMFASVFCAHTEDMDLCSINYLHCGAPKYWYAIAPAHSKRFESFCNSRFPHSHRACPDYLRHKQSLISPTLLKKAGIPFETAIQRPGDAILTYPGAYHFGVNLGFNIAEAVNFGIPEWIPLGRRATVCMCRPSSVRLDMEKFEALLRKYETDVSTAKLLGFPSLSYRQWAKVEWNRRQKKKEELEQMRRQRVQAIPEVVHVAQRPPPDAAATTTSSSSTRLNVILPPIVSSCMTTTTSSAAIMPTTTTTTNTSSNNNHIVPNGPTVSLMYDKNGKARMDKVWVTTELNDTSERKEDFWIEVMSPIATTESNNSNNNNNKSSSKKRPRKQQQQQQKEIAAAEEWRLAKPLSSIQRKKKLIVGTRVLVLLPSSSDDNNNNHSSDDKVCFAGQVVKVSENHALIHFAGLSKREDVWMNMDDSSKLFLDGGKWQEPSNTTTTTTADRTTTSSSSSIMDDDDKANKNNNKKAKKQPQSKKPSKKKTKKKDEQPSTVVVVSSSSTTTNVVVAPQQGLTLALEQQQPPQQPPQPEKVASG